MLTLERLESRSLLSACLVNGTLYITGPNTFGGTRFVYHADVAVEGDRLIVSEQFIGGQEFSFFRTSSVSNIVMRGAAWNANLLKNDTTIPTTMYGGNLADTLVGGEGFNRVYTGNGDDEVWLAGSGVVYATDTGHDTIHIKSREQPVTLYLSGNDDVIYDG